MKQDKKKRWFSNTNHSSGNGKGYQYGGNPFEREQHLFASINTQSGI